MEYTCAGVIFDNDGVLVDSKESLRRAWTQWAIECGVTADQFVGVRGHGRSSAEIVQMIVGEAASEEATRRIVELEVLYADCVEPLPGALDACQTIPLDQFAIATSGTADVAAARFAAAGIRARHVVTASDVRHAKPDPEIFTTAAGRLGFAPTECVVVEDAIAGVQAAKAAGCVVIALTTTTLADELRAVGADVVVADLACVEWKADATGITAQITDHH